MSLVASDGQKVLEAENQDFGFNPEIFDSPEFKRRQKSPEQGEPTSLATRSLWTLAAFILILWGLRLWAYVSLARWATPLAVLLIALGIMGLVLAWIPDSVVSPRRRKRIGWILLLAAIAGLAAWSYFQVFTLPAYGTDEIAFDQYAAQLALHGMNPYLHSMAPAFPLFHVSPNGYTFTLSGKPVTKLSYPALSFEPYMPFLAAGLKTQTAVWVNVCAWALTAVLLYTLLPAELCPLALVIASISVYISYAVGGITGVLFIPLLIAAAYKWDRFPTEKGWRTWIGPVCLGLAMSVKQTPWLVGIFLVAGIAMEAFSRQRLTHALKTISRYVILALAGFLVPNIPYLVSDPLAWFKGVLTPLNSHVVPAGQGLVSLGLYLGVGGGSIGSYSLLSIVVLVVTLALFITFYGQLKPIGLFLPAIALFFATRSFGSYFVMILPAALVGALSVSRVSTPRPIRCWPVVLTGGLGAIGAVACLALLARSPLNIEVISVHTTGQLATVDRVEVRVANTTSAPLRPSFTLESGSGITDFWMRSKGPAVLEPKDAANYILQAPNFYAMPSLTGGFQVLAFMTHPASFAASKPYLPTSWHVSLRPNVINHLVALGSTVTVKAELFNRFDQRVFESQVPVYLGQIIYAQRGLEFSQASINSSPPGQTPVEALTNSRGVATFRIYNLTYHANPIYFEANLVSPTSYYPYGYSAPLAIRYEARSP